MFDQLKDLWKMQQLQSALGKQEKTVEKNGCSATVNGKMEVLRIKINPTLPLDQQEKTVLECINEATREVQQQAINLLRQSQK
jgi:DNA-binding protein YbaB